MTPAVMPFLKAGAGILGTLFGKQKPQDDQPIESVMGTTEPSPPTAGSPPPEQGDKWWTEHARKFRDDAVSAGLGYLLAKPRGAAAGRAQRAENSAAFPGLTPWELTGRNASATAQSQATTQATLQRNEHRQQKDLQKENLKIAREQMANQQYLTDVQTQSAQTVAAISAGASNYGADRMLDAAYLNSEASRKRVYAEIDQIVTATNTDRARNQREFLSKTRNVVAEWALGHLSHDEALKMLGAIGVENSGKLLAQAGTRLFSMFTTKQRPKP